MKDELQALDMTYLKDPEKLALKTAGTNILLCQLRGPYFSGQKKRVKLNKITL